MRYAILATTVLLSLISMLLIGFPATNVEAQTVGIAVGGEPQWEITGGLYGEEYRTTVYLQYMGQDAMELNLAAEGDIADWMSFYTPDDMNLPTKKVATIPNQYVDVVLVVRIPDDAPVGTSTGVVTYSAAPPELSAEATDMNVSTQIQNQTYVAVTVVGTPVYSGVASNFTAKDTEVGYPVRILFDFENTGNVRVYPIVDLTILKAGETIDAKTVEAPRVERGAKVAIPVEWDTTFAGPGEYTATVAVRLGEQKLGTGEVSLAVFPKGTLTRAGSFTDLVLDDQTPELGKLAKFLASFANVGQVDTNAQFVAEIYRDGDLVDNLTSAPVSVPAGKSDIVVGYYKIEAPGQYRVSGLINYEGKTTDKREVTFTVVANGVTPGNTSTPNSGVAEEDDEDGSSSPIIWIVIGVVAALALIGSGIYLKKRTKAKA